MASLTLIPGGRPPGPSQDQLEGNPEQAEPARRLAIAREAAGMSWRQVAEQTGLTLSELKNLERGLFPIDQRLQHVFCSLYNVDPDWLMAHLPITLTWKDLSPELQARLSGLEAQIQIRALNLLARLGYRRD